MTVSHGLCGTSHFSCSFFMPFPLDFVYFTNFKFFQPWSDIAAFRSPILVVRTVFVVKVQRVLVQPSRPSAFCVYQKLLHCGVVAKFHSRNPLGTLCVSDRSRFSLVRILTSLLQPSPHFLGVRSLPRVHGANFVFAHATISPLPPCQIQSDRSPWHAWCSLCDMIS